MSIEGTAIMVAALMFVIGVISGYAVSARTDESEIQNINAANGTIEIIGQQNESIPTGESIVIPPGKTIKFACSEDGKFLSGIWAFYGDIIVEQEWVRITDSIGANTLSVTAKKDGKTGGIMFLVENIDGKWEKVADCDLEIKGD